ncbi:MAG: mcpA 1 [Firmicutes bacterium]|nr:mcpA 1 [Bacillota bacterium]
MWKSLRTKLTVVIVLLFVVALGTLAALNYWQAKKVIQQNIETNLVETTQAEAAKISSTLAASQTELMTMARTPILASGDATAIQSYLYSEATNNRVLYEALLWSDINGNFVDAFGGTGSIANAPFFQPALKGQPFIFGPTIAEKTGNPVVIIAVPVKNATQQTGIVLGIVNVSAVAKIVDNIKICETGSAHIIQNNGTIVFHPIKERLNKNILTDSNTPPGLKAIAERAIKGETGVNQYDLGSMNTYIAYTPIQGTNWSIVVNVPVSEATSQLSAFAWISIFTIIVVLAIVIAVIYFFAIKITKPLITLEAAANSIASGNLSLASLNITTEDELGRVATAFETMVNNLRTLVHQISSSSGQVAAASEELTANAEQSAQASNQVAISITDVAAGTDNQSNAVNNALILVKNITASAQTEAAQSKNTAAIVNQAVESANTGNKAVITAISQMTSIRQTVDNSAQVVAELGESSKEIGQIVETISGIASQTNLLALNAAIEAARAGEQGKGFAVVAEEVRKLAEQSQEAAKQITTLISDIQSKTTEAVISMTNGTQEVRRGTEVVDQAGTAFRDIDHNLKEAAVMAQKATNAMDQQVKLSLDVLTAIEQVNKISQEISSQSQNISAATEEQSASMEEIASSSQHLAMLAEELRIAINQFKM